MIINNDETFNRYQKNEKWRNISWMISTEEQWISIFLTKEVKVHVFYCITELKMHCIFLLPNCQLSPPVTPQCKTSLIKLLPSPCHICPSPQLLNKHGQVFAISNSWSVPINTKNQDKCAYWTKHLSTFYATSLIPLQPSKWVTLNGKIIIIK